MVFDVVNGIIILFLLKINYFLHTHSNPVCTRSRTETKIIGTCGRRNRREPEIIIDATRWRQLARTHRSLLISEQFKVQCHNIYITIRHLYSSYKLDIEWHLTVLRTVLQDGAFIDNVLQYSMQWVAQNTAVCQDCACTHIHTSTWRFIFSSEALKNKFRHDISGKSAAT